MYMSRNHTGIVKEGATSGDYRYMLNIPSQYQQISQGYFITLQEKQSVAVSSHRIKYNNQIPLSVDTIIIYRPHAIIFHNQNISECHQI